MDPIEKLVPSGLDSQTIVAEGGDQTLFKHHVDLSISKVRRSLG